MKFDVSKLEWTRKPKDYSISADKIEIIKISERHLLLVVKCFTKNTAPGGSTSEPPAYGSISKKVRFLVRLIPYR